MSIQHLPGFLFPLPDVIADCQVVGALRIPPRAGELPDQTVLMGRDPYASEDRAYTVWNAAVRDGDWDAFSGAYDLSYAQAVDEYLTRIRGLNLGARQN
jgi:hypothetical protein